MSFYVRNTVEYFNLKRKCSEDSVVQIIDAKNRNTYVALRIDWRTFGPSFLNVYEKNISVYQIYIKYNWMISDLYQLCKECKKMFLLNSANRNLF